MNVKYIKKSRDRYVRKYIILPEIVSGKKIHILKHTQYVGRYSAKMSKNVRL